MQAFRYDGIVARVAVLRQYARQNEDKELHYDELYSDSQDVMSALPEEKVDLTRKEFELLQYLLQIKGLVADKKSDLCHVWDMTLTVKPNQMSMETPRQNWRGKNLIETVRGDRIGA